jgi:large subunit ribosomal protein L10
MKIDSVSDFLTGPTAIALSKEDTNDVAKILYDFVKEAPALEIKGGYVSSEVYDAVKLAAFSKLPGKKQRIAMMMSAINGPVQKLAATIQAYVDKKAAEGGAPAAKAEAPQAAPAEAPKVEAVEAPAEAPKEAASEVPAEAPKAEAVEAPKEAPAGEETPA